MSTLSITTLQDRASSINTPVMNAIRGSARAWCRFNTAGSLLSAYNVVGVTNDTTGQWTITLVGGIVPSSNYSVVASYNGTSAVTGFRYTVNSSTSITINATYLTGGSVLAINMTDISVIVVGDQ